ncbi:MAG: TetR family transcriptional regulator [Conexibacter sp.]|jgi:AcrR family transcriptional regulator|nr:TetR family transcriptional regulator [Conexibacter sp.]
MALPPPTDAELPPGAPLLPPPAEPPSGASLTAEKLLQAAHELLYERSGGHAAVSEICARAGVNVAMVSYCFGSKDGLLDALVERVMLQLSADIGRLALSELTPSEMLELHVAAIVRNYVRYPYVNRLMNERLLSADGPAVDRMSLAFAVPARDWYADLLQQGRELEGWRETDPTLFFFSVIGLCEFLFAGRAWLERAFAQPMDAALVERFIEHTTGLIARAMRP